MMEKNREKLLQLVKDNPDLPIIPATYFEVCCDDWGYWVGDLEDVRVDYFHMTEDYWYAGEDEIKNRIQSQLENSLENEVLDKLSDEEFKKLIDDKFQELVASGEIKKAIIMFIGV